MPALLAALALTGCIVTSDAMGCQTAIAAQILAQEADSVLALKENQPTLHELVVHHVAGVTPTESAGLAQSTHPTLDKDHGRLEVRRCWVGDDPAVLAWLDPARTWPGLRSIVCVEGERRIGATVTGERRSYLSSLAADATRMARAVRGHWGIEHRLHWVLDVAFREDERRGRIGQAAENFAVLRQLALNLLRRETTAKVGTHAKRLIAGWDATYLAKVLAG